MDEWNDTQPIYRQLRGRVVAMILDGLLKEGEPLPSVRTVAAETRVNPLTVLKGYQELVDQGVIETRRGLGMFVTTGARNVLLQAERRGRIGRTDVARRLMLISDLPIATDQETTPRAWRETLSLARAENLTAYDAAYLELAERAKRPLMTRDKTLRDAARTMRLLWEPKT